MKNVSHREIKKYLLDISETQIRLAEKYALATDDEKELIFYGAVLDNAYKLRAMAEKLWGDATEQ